MKQGRWGTSQPPPGLCNLAFVAQHNPGRLCSLRRLSCHHNPGVVTFPRVVSPSCNCRSFTHRAPTREGLLPAELSRPHRDVGHHLPLAAVRKTDSSLSCEFPSTVRIQSTTVSSCRPRGTPSYVPRCFYEDSQSSVMLKCDHSIYAFEGQVHQVLRKAVSLARALTIHRDSQLIFYASISRHT